MAFCIIFWIIALLADAATYYFNGWWDADWGNLFGSGDIWPAIIWPIALALAYWLALFFLWILYVALKGQILTYMNKEGKTTKWRSFIFAETTWLVRRFFLVTLHFRGRSKLPKDGVAFMLATNHLSAFDHFCLISLFPSRRFACVSKASNFDIFGAGGWMKHNGYLSIKQNDIAEGAAVIEKAGEKIKDGVTICIAPEGTRNRFFPEKTTLPFHPGSFEMAYIAKCPIVVASVQNTHAILKRFPFRRTKVYIDVVAVYEYEDYKDLPKSQVAEMSRAAIENQLEEKSYRTYHCKTKQHK